MQMYALDIFIGVIIFCALTKSVLLNLADGAFLATINIRQSDTLYGFTPMT